MGWKKGEAKRKAGRPPKWENKTAREKAAAEAELNKRTVGHPTLYNAKFAAKICLAVSTSTKSLRQLCQIYSWFPSEGTIYGWLAKYPEFLSLYRQARLDQSMIWADELIEIADTARMGQIRTVSGLDKKGKPIVTETKVVDMLERCKVQIQARQWLLSKMRPREYGDRIIVDNPDNPVNA